MKEINLKLTEQEVNLIISGLGKLPAEISFNLIIKVTELINISKNKIEDGKE